MKPAHVWFGYAVCVAASLAVAGRLVHLARTAERDRAEATAHRRAADIAARAVWRMESALLPLLVQEASRPPQDYFAFRRRVGSADTAVVERSSRPSPLLLGFVPFTRLHFRIGADGEVRSPQAPRAALRDAALRRGIPRSFLREAERRQALLRELLRRRPLTRAIIEAEDRAEERSLAASEAGSLMERLLEYRLRRLSVARIRRAVGGGIEAGSEQTTGMRPYEVEGEILLARHVVHNGQPFILGCWLDTDAIVRRLQEDVRDLLPEARVVRAAESQRGEGIALASLPLVLLPGDLPPDAEQTEAELRWPLLVALAALAVTLVALAFLVRLLLADQRRRTAFVHAVTHELRTPLTSLRMYADLLAEERLRGREAQRRAVEAIHRETRRLEHLVENVLAYSRLEARGGRRDDRVETMLPDLLARSLERASELASTRGASLDLVTAPGLERVAVLADPTAVDRIVFNLVDNALKYGRPPVEVAVSMEGSHVLLRVRDHGPGVDRAIRRRLFRPFSKSVHEAARSAPGTGLGLALSRRLARSNGGDLTYVELDDGAAFELSLPAVPDRGSAGCGSERCGAL